MARIKKLEGNFKRKPRVATEQTNRARQRSEQRNPETDQKQSEEYARANRSKQYREEEEEEENLDEELEEEDEERIAGSSLTRRRHHAREEVNRVGQIKSRPKGFSSNGHRTNKRVLLRRATGTRTTLRRALEPEQETRRERAINSRVNRRRAAAAETQALSERRRSKSTMPLSQPKYSGNGQAGLRSTGSTRRTREERTQSTLRASRRRER